MKHPCALLTLFAVLGMLASCASGADPMKETASPPGSGQADGKAKSKVGAAGTDAGTCKADADIELVGSENELDRHLLWCAANGDLPAATKLLKMKPPFGGDPDTRDEGVPAGQRSLACAALPLFL